MSLLKIKPNVALYEDLRHYRHYLYYLISNQFNKSLNMVVNR